MRRVVGAMVLASCAPFQGVCVDDNNDGTCDIGGSACPDGDDDGVCDEDDVCANGDDAVDGDADGLADACDGCPDVEGDDVDGDGRCGTDDPCPEDADDACTETVFVGVQADVFPDDLTWQLVDFRGSLIDSGSFNKAGDGAFNAVEVSPTRQSCLTVRDSGRDGGARGLVFSRARALRYLRWSGEDAQSGYSACFTPESGDAFTPPREADWLDDGACDVIVTIQTGKYPLEIGWALELPTGPLSETGRVVIESGPGTFTQANRAVEKRFTLTDGTWNFRMFDTAGDGWQLNGDSASYTIQFANGGEIVAGTLDDGTMGWQSFSVDCG